MDKTHTVGFLLKDLSRLYVQRFEEHAKSISMTLMQCKVLVNLDRSEGVSQAKLAEMVSVEPMAMVRLLDRMEEDDLIERRPDPADRRARQLYLTRKAKPKLDEIWRLAAVVRTEMLEGVSKSDRDIFLRVLDAAHANLSALEREAN
ncbi:MAG: MarR family transcriptional regulator [Steroidobacteraceae bacterium]